MGLRLIIEDEEGATTIVPLGEEEVTIGREPGNTIQLTEQNVSRQHARLTQGPDGWVIEDLDSYNGVKVNGVLVEGSVTLNEGDVVQIGDYHLALSNNVEQTTLNLDRPSQAANDAARTLPSVALPSIGRAEIESGQVPAFTPPTEHHSSSEEEQGGGSKGLLLALGVVLMIGLGFVAYKFIAPGANTNQQVTKNDKGDPPTKSDGKEPGKAVTPPTTPPDSGGDTPPDPSGAPPDSGDTPPDPTNTGLEDPPPEPVSKKTTPKKDTPKKDVPKKDPKADAPKGDPAALLDDARKASLANNATQAYELSKKSYEIDKNVAALQLMGVSACKMGDPTKAKAAFKKLEASRQKQLQAVCAERGISLE